MKDPVVKKKKGPNYSLLQLVLVLFISVVILISFLFLTKQDSRHEISPADEQRLIELTQKAKSLRDKLESLNLMRSQDMEIKSELTIKKGENPIKIIEHKASKGHSRNLVIGMAQNTDPKNLVIYLLLYMTILNLSN